MLRSHVVGVIAAAVILAVAASAGAAELKPSLSEGTPGLQAAGPICFGPEGILFVADTKSAAIFAIDTGDKGGSASAGPLNIAAINEKIASLLGISPRDLLITDMAVHPASKQVYFSVLRGRGPEATPVLLRANAAGEISELSLEKVKFAKSELPGAPADRPGRRNPRRDSITDLAYIDGRLLVAGLSNEEFSSKLRSLPFPFDEAAAGASVEIFHGAHGRFETASPVRTFVPYDIAGEPHLLAAYTCTPLVKFPISELKPGNKVKGTTIAELGNRNRPLDMIVYKQEGKDFILIANSSRGLMKVTTEGLDVEEGITQRISGTAGVGYDTIEDLKGVVQLDRYDEANALVLVMTEDGVVDLKTVALP